MKKTVRLLFCFFILVTFAGCGNDNTSVKTAKQPLGVKDVLEAEMAKEDEKNDLSSQPEVPADDYTDIERRSGINENAPEPEPVNDSETISGASEGIDVDLTKLSSTMVYSEVYNMLYAPEEYMGKTVKMDGQFAFYHDKATDDYFFACIIADATACCSQGIEFVLTDDYKYPEDYPEAGDEVCVEGVFDTYQDGDYTYCTLRNAKLVA